MKTRRPFECETCMDMVALVMPVEYSVGLTTRECIKCRMDYDRNLSHPVACRIEGRHHRPHAEPVACSLTGLQFWDWLYHENKRQQARIPF